jgi:hypothetical protein
MLHLDRHVRPVARPRAVDLPERGDGELLLVDVVEQLADAGVEVLLDDPSHTAERDGSRAVGQHAGRCGRVAVELEHREELRDLRPGALEPAELVTELAGEGEGACIVPGRAHTLSRSSDAGPPAWRTG